MEPDALYKAIQADDDAKALAAIGNDSGCAARISAILPKRIVTRQVSDLAIFAAFEDPSIPEQLMQALEAAADSNPVVRRSLIWLRPNNGGVDVGHPATRALLDQLAQVGAIPQSTADVIKALAEEPQIITANEVSAAMRSYRGEDGRIQA